MSKRPDEKTKYIFYQSNTSFRIFSQIRKGLKATDLKIYIPDRSDELTVNYLLNDFDHDVTIIAVQKSGFVSPVILLYILMYVAVRWATKVGFSHHTATMLINIDI